MAQWKKVIVSGSTANLANVQVDSLTSGQVVIGGGTAGNLTTTAINGTGNIVATTGASGLVHSGSFSGSFTGNFVGTTDLPDLTQGTGITAFTYDGATTATVAVSGASTLSSNNITKWTGTAFANSSLTDNGTAITGTPSIQLTGASSNLSGSFSGSFQGDGTNLTGVTATAIFPTTAKTDLASTDQFFINDGVNKYVTYSDLLTDLAGTNLAVEGTDSLTLATTITGLTSVTSTTFVGNLTGTATTASNITPAITNNTDNYILTATGNNPNGESNLTFDGTTLTVTGNATITNNLTVQGTASFQNTTNLEIADRFVLFASGSNTTGDGGIVVQQGTQNVGELYGYDSATTRWGFTSSFSADQSSFTPIAHITTTEFAASNPSTAPIYGGSSNGYGNIHVNSSTGDIFIYA
jgi:hypothetical protein